jgi:hypothetical protein
MFKSAALALCCHSVDGVDRSEALLSSLPLLTTTLMGGVLVGRAVERRMVLRNARLVWHAGGGVDDDVPRERGHESNPLIRC